MKYLNLAFQITAYYLAWFLGLILAAKGSAWLAFFVIFLISTIQIVWQINMVKEKGGLFLMMAIFTLMGTVVDSIFMHCKLIDFNANPFKPYLSPPWMMAIWFNFSILFYSILKKYRSRYLLLAILSLIAFPGAYTAGVKLGAATLAYGYLSSLALGAVWAFLFPLCLYIYNVGIKYRV